MSASDIPGPILKAVDEELGRLGSSLRSNPDTFYSFASGERYLRLSWEEEAFSGTLTENAIPLAEINTSSVAMLAPILDAFLVQRQPLEFLVAFSPAIEPLEQGLAYSRGPQAYAEYEWHHWREHYAASSPGNNRFGKSVYRLIIAAMETPQLRRLFPFISLNRLCLSLCTVWPYKVAGLPRIGSGPEGSEEYFITTDWEGTNEITIRGVERTVATAVSMIPADLPPVFHGSVSRQEYNEG